MADRVGGTAAVASAIAAVILASGIERIAGGAVCSLGSREACA